MTNRLITVNGISYNTIKCYILEIEQVANCNKHTFDWTIDKAATKSLGSVELPSYKIRFTGMPSSVEPAYKKFRQLIFRGGG